MLDISDDTVRTLFAQTVEPTAVLMTITAAGLDDPVYVTDYPGDLPTKGEKGLISRNLTFAFFPFGVQWSGAGGGEVARDAVITIGNTSGEIAAALEQVTDQPVISLEVVRVAAPDVVERALSAATLSSTQEDGPQIKGTIKARRFDIEPACSKSYLPSTCPAMF